MSTSIVTREDMNYLAQQSANNLNLILSGMTALLRDNDNKVNMLENQTWFQRMCRTISGKNKMTQQEIQRNHDKINTYMTQAMTELYEQQCIDRQIMMSLGNQLNELYAEQLQIKQMLGAFVSKLNEKIESIDNFHMLNTEIEQGIYSSEASIVSVCRILSQMDKRCIQDYRKMNILRRSMAAQNILNGSQLSLTDYLMSIVDISMDEVGQIYMELSTIRGNFMANIILDIIESYHFLPDMARKMKNKAVVVQSVIENEQLDATLSLTIDEVYDDLVNSKLDMIEGLLPISEIQYDAKLAEAEKLFLGYKIDEALDIINTLAEKGVGRAMYLLGYYYFSVSMFEEDEENEEKAKKWMKAGFEAGDILASVGFAYSLPEDSTESQDIFRRLFSRVYDMAESGDNFAQYELARLYLQGNGTEENEKEGMYWMEKSADGGNWFSMISLAFSYEPDEDEESSDEDYLKSFEWYRKAAEKGHNFAQLIVELFFYDGYGSIESDKIEAVKWVKLAAESGLAVAKGILGEYYENGDGVKKDMDLAIKWYVEASKGGCDESTNQLGDIEYEKENYVEAVKWYTIAAERGYDDSQNNLGVCYEYGKGVAKDCNIAFSWYMKAAKQEHSTAQRNLARLYYYGDGVNEDKVKAREWLIKSANHGNKNAIKYLKEWFGETV